MKIACPCCTEQFKKTEFKVARKGSSGIEKQCPGCSQWLRPEPKMEQLKYIGLFILLLASLLNFYFTDIDLKMIFSGISFAGASLAFFAFWKETFEAVDN